MSLLFRIYTINKKGHVHLYKKIRSTFLRYKKVLANSKTNTYSVSFGKTVEYGEDELGIPVWIVGEEDAHGVHQHLVQAGREHRLRQLTQVFLQQA